MKKLLILMGILMIGLTLAGCDGTTEERVPPVYAGVTVESVNPFDGTQLITYYKGKRADLAVKIDVVNTSNFAISSIKINGKNYRDFTDQSTNSVLYFNLNTGSTLGETIYSVDEIVYRDGDNTKTVYVDSNNEFEVYVYKDLPTVERENYELEKDTISIDFNVVDTDSVIV